MIKANEAAVGRIFNRELRTQRGLEYDHEFVLTGEWMGKLFGDDISISLGDLFPIPLSSEWLERLGAKKYSHEPGYSIGSEEKDERCDEYALGKLTIMDWGAGFILSNSFSFSLRVELKHVHQLQNLYFAITGEELTLTTPEGDK